MRHMRATLLLGVLGLLALALLLSACGAEPAAPSASETATATATLTSTPTAQTALTVTPAQTPGTGSTSPPAVEGDGTSAEEIAAAVASRTPVPTPTPGLVSEQVDQFAAAVGLSGKSFLGLTTEDWINLAISLLIALLGYLLGVRLLFAVLKQVAHRTSTPFDDVFLDTIGPELKWLVMVLFWRFALLRLDFWSDGLRTVIDDVIYVLGLGVLLAIALRLIRFAVEWYQDNLEPRQDRERLDPIITMFQRFGYMLVIITWMSMILSHLGINITALSAALVFAALVISLGARDIISDAISGFIILIDQPFRVGDSIEIEELDKVGEVVEIGTRTTHIRTKDNRLVTIPNSTMGASQVINYSYPDPTYRVQIVVGVAYGSDFDQVRCVIHDAVRGVDGVLPDKPVDALYHEFGASSRTIRVRFWIDNVRHEWPIVDQVSEALEIALTEAGIDLPFDTENVVLSMDPQTVQQLSQPQG